MKIGAHCVLYGPEISTDTNAVIQRLKEVGAQGCELGERFFNVESRKELTDVLEAHNVELAGMHCNNLHLMDLLNEPEKSYLALEKVAQFVQPLPNKNIIATGMVGDIAVLSNYTIAQGAPQPELHIKENAIKIAQNLNHIALKLLEKYNVQVNYHNHSWEFCDEGMLWFALADYAPNVMFALDTGWAGACGYDPVELMNKYPNRFHYVHLRDYKKGDDVQAKSFTQVHSGFIALGEGDMDYPKLMRKLSTELAPNDWAVVEYELGNFDKNSYLKALSYVRGMRDML